MSKSIKMKEIVNQSQAEVLKNLADTEVRINHLRLQAVRQDLKDVRAIRAARVTRARLATKLSALNHQSTI